MKINSDNLSQEFWGFLRLTVPRVLSQLDRDEDSPTFGSFDRNYWHYKIRDFSSIILQQGMLIINTLASWNHDNNPLYQHALTGRWIEGCINFWASQQLRSGAFNEYYPYENGYPPTAFSLYAVGIIYTTNPKLKPSLKTTKAIQKTCNWLLDHPEIEALNQNAAGLAGIALTSKIQGIKIDENKFQKQLSYFFSQQSEEGWFPEYGGPDIGYLSVTTDCLYDYFSVTNDTRAKDAINKAIGFIAKLIGVNNETPIMINSRNTDYLVPYGLVKASTFNPQAGAIVRALYHNLGKEGHFLCRTDDRYLCHYVYQSCFRSLPFLKDIDSKKIHLPFHESKEFFLKESGIWVKHIFKEKSIFVAVKKGGIFYQCRPEQILYVDFGWRKIIGKGKIAVTHWQNEANEVSIKKASDQTIIVIKGKMKNHSWMKSSPLKHSILRILSFLLGNRLIPLLKKVMIFGKHSSDISFYRKLIISVNQVEIHDNFNGLNIKKQKLYRAPHHSLRHVASAGLFAPEELLKQNSNILKEHNTSSYLVFK